MSKYKFETLQLHAGQERAESEAGCRAVPIYQTTSYVFDNAEDAEDRFALKKGGNIYTRINNPTTEVLEKRLAALEGGTAALAVASGSAAVFYTVCVLCGAGDNFVTANTLYGGTFNLFANSLKNFGIEARLVHPDNPADFEKLIDEKTKMIFVESLGNPNCNIPDFEKYTALAKKYGIPFVVDNTFSPFIFRPFDHGADVVIYSTTKFIGGHGTSIGGAIIDGGSFDWAQNDKFKSLTEPDPSYHGIKYTESFKGCELTAKARVIWLRDTGACISPFNSFLLLQGLETLSLRMERHILNTKKVVEYLDASPYVAAVNYPDAKGNRYQKLAEKYFPAGAGSIFTIEIKGGKPEAKKFIDSLKLWSNLANVADAKSLIIHPATTTHSQLNDKQLKDADLTPSTLRLSIGIEHYEDIIGDLEQAFQATYGAGK